MDKRITIISSPALVTATLLLASCMSPVSPDRTILGPPRFALGAPGAPGLDLDQWNGSLSENSSNPASCDGANPCFIKGFNPQNPHVGDAIIATFFWVGSTNIINSVTDHLTDIYRTPVGNQYTLVRYVTDGTVSMATYVATNVQNFPDASTDGNAILAVRANLSQNVPDGGIVMAAYSGLPVTVGPSAAAQGSGSDLTVAAPGQVSAAAGGLIYGVTMSGTLVGADEPGVPFLRLAQLTDNFLTMHADHALFSNGGTVSPQWTWYFDPTHPGNWLATAVVLNPAATHLGFTTQPTTTLPLMPITPAVRVAALDDLGHTITSFSGSVTIAIGKNGGLVVPGTLSGTKTMSVVNGVATFSDLSIDQLGNGYTLTVTTSGLRGAESNPFNIGAM